MKIKISNTVKLSIFSFFIACAVMTIIYALARDISIWYKIYFNNGYVRTVCKLFSIF